MKKIAGHTLGTPGMSVVQALELFHDVGLDAAEIIWQDDYEAGIPESDAASLIKNIRRTAASLCLDIAGLTPYMSGFNSLDIAERERDYNRMLECIRTAQQLDCHNIRVYAGSYKSDDSQRQEKFRHLVDSMQKLGEKAHEADIYLCVENHFNTMTVTAQETVQLIEAVNLPSVRILYDQANLAFTHSENYEQAIALQEKWIQHVHVKDLIFVDPNKPFSADAVERVKAEDRAVRSRVVGEGSLEWYHVLKALDKVGYTGYLSLEYEYRWHPQDLPDPTEGFRRGAEYLRNMVAEIQENRS